MGGAMTILQLLVVVPAVVPVESTTLGGEAGGSVSRGVPVMAPVEGLSVRPRGEGTGSDAEDVAAGARPRRRAKSYRPRPSVARGTAHVSAMGGADDECCKLVVVVPAVGEIHHLAVKLEVPEAVGVPVMAAVDAVEAGQAIAVQAARTGKQC